MPRISCLVSAYNADKYLNGRLQNLLCEQTERDIEVIVLNPNSPGLDGVIAQSWAQKDNRVKYIELPERNNYGEAWTLMWKMAQSNLVVNTNADDRLSSDCLKIMCDRMESALPNIGFAYTDMVVIDTNGRQRGYADRPPFDAEAMKSHCLCGPSVVWINTPEIRAKIDWDKLSQRGKEYVSAWDYYLWLYLMSLGYQGLSLRDKRSLVYYLQRPDSIEHQNYGNISTWESLASISEFFPHVFIPGGRLHKEHPEFASFANLPDKELWCSLRKRGKKWNSP
jgi:glycosyltransferase involved in cell wall biosynthesis